MTKPATEEYYSYPYHGVQIEDRNANRSVSNSNCTAIYNELNNPTYTPLKREGKGQLGDGPIYNKLEQDRSSQHKSSEHNASSRVKQNDSYSKSDEYLELKEDNSNTEYLKLKGNESNVEYTDLKQEDSNIYSSTGYEKQVSTRYPEPVKDEDPRFYNPEYFELEKENEYSCADNEDEAYVVPNTHYGKDELPLKFDVKYKQLQYANKNNLYQKLRT